MPSANIKRNHKGIQETTLKDYVQLPPFVEIREENGTGIIAGFMPDILRSIAEVMDLELQWIREPEDRYGTWENGTWTGLCGMLFRNEVDIIVNPLLPGADYAEVAYYTNPVIYEAMTILSGKQKKEGGFFMYFSVLQPKVWASIGITLLVMVLLSALLYLRIIRSPQVWKSAFLEYFWVYVASMLREAPSDKWVFLNPKRRTMLLHLMPLLITFWMVGISLVIMTVFQSLLVSKLAIVRSTPVVDSLDEFVLKDDVIGIAPYDIELHEILKDSGIQIYEDAWKKLEPYLIYDDVFTDKFFKGVEDGSQCIFHGVLILKSVLAKYFQEKGKCDFHISNNAFYPFPLLMALQPSLPKEFLIKFNYGLTRLIDADLSGKWFKPIFEHSTLCTSYSDSTLKPLSLKHIYGVLIIWTGGMAASLAVFIIEKMSYAGRPATPVHCPRCRKLL